ncbi:sesquipedalian-1-like [Chanos chanos]|uniref:Sesquipedalian n=1 Tax=Chanos chanos TaxID=29144 RepID=A0A6J2VFP9_CHACN|nr:sesquipedalian-1-like [Chanos chanos]
MKLHRKILNYYLSCSSPVDKEGYLCKKGELNTSYQKRWFVLKGNLLFYQDRPGDKEAIGVIVLEDCSVQLCESDEQFAFSVVFSEPGQRTYKFAAEDQSSQEGWIKALSFAHHSCLALLLKDLQEQYVDASKAAGTDPVSPSEVAEKMAQSQRSTFSTGSVFYTQNSGPGVKETGGPTSNQLLQVPPASGKTANKKSPKLWSKRSTHSAPINGPSPPMGEWLEPMEEFDQLHEHFGKEVKELIADWLKRHQEEKVVPEDNLIDFG